MADASGNAQAGAAREIVLKSLSTTDLTTGTESAQDIHCPVWTCLRQSLNAAMHPRAAVVPVNALLSDPAPLQCDNLANYFISFGGW